MQHATSTNIKMWLNLECLCSISRKTTSAIRDLCQLWGCWVDNVIRQAMPTFSKLADTVAWPLHLPKAKFRGYCWRLCKM